jgi:hypothetical protein
LAVSDYAGLITHEHIDKPNFISWLKAPLAIGDNTYNCAADINAVYDIDNAVGTQLDAIGTMLNRSRIVPFQLSAGTADNPSFVWGTPLDNEGGWNVGYWQLPTETSSLDDENYRILLKATVAKTHWTGSIADLSSLLSYVFLNYYIDFTVTDNQDMSFSVDFSGSFSSTLRDLLSHDLIVPRPEGVTLNVTVKVKSFIVSGGTASSVETDYSYVIDGGTASTNNSKIYEYVGN